MIGFSARVDEKNIPSFSVIYSQRVVFAAGCAAGNAAGGAASWENHAARATRRKQKSSPDAVAGPERWGPSAESWPACLLASRPAWCPAWRGQPSWPHLSQLVAHCCEVK